MLNLEDEKYKNMIENVSTQLQKARLGDYMDLMQNPVRMLALNFFAGIARGLGLAVGFTILGALTLYFLKRLVILNLPIIGGVISEVVKMIKLNIR